jgi:hypothetical protein
MAIIDTRRQREWNLWPLDEHGRPLPAYYVGEALNGPQRPDDPCDDWSSLP